jgi:site-specific DNA-methyltransferase (adenine-specific)
MRASPTRPMATRRWSGTRSVGAGSRALRVVLKPAASLWVFGSMRFLAPVFDEGAPGLPLQPGHRVGEAERHRLPRRPLPPRPRARRLVLPRRVVGRAPRHAVHRGRHGARGAPQDAAGAHRPHRRPQLRQRRRRAAHDAQRLAGQERARPCDPSDAEAASNCWCRLVRYSVPPGGSLIVPFAGSGSECLAAHQEGRHAVGIERDPEMADLARARIAADAPLFAEVACA